MKSAIVFLSSACLLIFLFFLVVQTPSDSNVGNHSTWNILLQLGFRLRDIPEKEIDVEKLGSIAAILSFLRTRNAEDGIAEDDLEIVSFDKDFWGRTFRVMTKKEPKSIIILSDGENGINEDGQGDDLSVEVLYEQKGTRMVSRYLHFDGRVEIKKH